MNTVAFGNADFTSPPTEPSNHWCVCSGKVVIGGLFDTKAEAMDFARQSMNTHAHLSIHHVGAEVSP